MRLVTVCPLTATLPALKQRMKMLAVDGKRSILKSLLNTVETRATRWGIESSGFGYKIQRASELCARNGIPLSYWQIHQSHTAPRRTTAISPATRLLGFMISAPRAIKLKQFAVFVRSFLLSCSQGEI